MIKTENKRFKLLNDNKYMPSKAYDGDAGYDIALPERVFLPKNSVKKIDLKVAVKLKRNELGIICMRSSAATELNVIANTSPIDSGYKGSINLIIHNLSSEDIWLLKAKVICQLVIFKTKYTKGRFGKRMKNGFGSTGTNYHFRKE